MRTEEGLPHKVFSELGVTPEQVEEHARTGQLDARPMGKLYSPEEAAEYLTFTWRQCAPGYARGV